jgi:two-component system OmpR family response regulator
VNPKEYPTADRLNLLIVEDEIVTLQTLAHFFTLRGFHVTTAGSLREAQTRFWSQQSWAVILSDYHLSDGTGLDLHSWLQEQPGIPAPFLLMSGGIQAARADGVEFIAKPFGLLELEARVHAVLRGGISEPSCSYGV